VNCSAIHDGPRSISTPEKGKLDGSFTPGL